MEYTYNDATLISKITSYFEKETYFPKPSELIMIIYKVHKFNKGEEEISFNIEELSFLQKTIQEYFVAINREIDNLLDKVKANILCLEK